LWAGLFLLILTIITAFRGVLMMINNTDDFIFLNTIVIPVLCIAKFNSLKKRKTKYHYLFLIPAVIGIIMFLIKLF
jgi:aminopeptidase-like protein